MTSEDVRSELDRQPFVPFRFHLVSGKEVAVMMPGAAWMMQNAVMVLHDPRGVRTEKYDVVALRNIERIEQLEVEQ